MPPKTQAKTPGRPRRPSPTPGAAGRFSRSNPTPSTGGRFGRPTPSPSGRFGLSGPTSQKRGAPGKPKSRGKSSAKGGLGGLLSSLPMDKLGKKTKKGSPAAKATPVLALVAAGAGALFGRKQLRKRKEEEPTPLTTPPVTVTPPSMTDTTPQTSGPRPVDPTAPAAPDAL